MNIKRNGQLTSVDFHINQAGNAHSGFAILTFSRNTGGVVHSRNSYTARTFQEIRNAQRAANRFTMRVLTERKDVTITIKLWDVNDAETDRVIANIKQAYALLEFGGKIVSVVRKNKFDQETS